MIKADKSSIVIVQLDDRIRILEAKTADAETRTHLLGLAKENSYRCYEFQEQRSATAPRVYVCSFSILRV